MALIQSMEATGAKLFKYRGQIPVLIFVLALPLMWFTNSNLYVWETWGSPLMVVCTVCAAVLTLAGLALRAYTVCTTPKGTSGRNTARQVADHLNTKGIYSVVRHPLYLANYLIWAGLLVFTMNICVFLVVSLVYWIYYERIMMAEEAFLRSKYGDEFEEWAAECLRSSRNGPSTKAGCSNSPGKPSSAASTPPSCPYSSPTPSWTTSSST